MNLKRLAEPLGQGRHLAEALGAAEINPMPELTSAEFLGAEGGKLKIEFLAGQPDQVAAQVARRGGMGRHSIRRGSGGSGGLGHGHSDYIQGRKPDSYGSDGLGQVGISGLRRQMGMEISVFAANCYLMPQALLISL